MRNHSKPYQNRLSVSKVLLDFIWSAYVRVYIYIYIDNHRKSLHFPLIINCLILNLEKKRLFIDNSKNQLILWTKKKNLNRLFTDKFLPTLI